MKYRRQYPVIELIAKHQINFIRFQIKYIWYE